ncbi:MAG: ThuA domain-containing protein [Planctomycetes bacterium]|nr:ThuA domain-containing protein [Planctomycetota bacterium]
MVTSLALLAFGGVAGHFAWRYYRLTASAAEDARRLVHSLVESASGAKGRASRIRVAIFAVDGHGGNAMKNLEAILSSESTCTWAPVGPTDIQTGALDGFDLVVFPGGSGSQQAEVLGEEGRHAVREFVRAGGGYVGICGGTFLATARYDWSLALVNAKTLTGRQHIPELGMRSMTQRGAGTVKMEFTEPGKRVLGNFPDLVDVQYAGGPILSPAGKRDLPAYATLALFRTEIWRYEPQQGTMVDTPAIIAARFGRGRVIAFSPHPETTEGLEVLVKRAVLSTAREPVH